MRAANGVFMAELTKKCKRLWTKPGIRWLCGYFFVLLCGVGLVYYWRVAYSLGAGMPGFAAATTLIICGGFSAVYLLVFLAAHFLKQNLALKTAVLVFLAGLCFVFANPPMQAPDETMHFLRAYAVGSGQFLFDEKQQFPNDVNLLVRDFPGAYINGVSGEKLAPDDPTIADAFARYSADKAAGAVAPGAFTPVQQLVPYFPQALGVAVGRLFGADALACMYLARAANLLCYAVLCGYAAAVIRRFSAVLIALAISPVSLFMAGSCSSDGLFMGLTWIFIALCLDVPRKIHHAGAAAAVAAAAVRAEAPQGKKGAFGRRAALGRAGGMPGRGRYHICAADRIYGAGQQLWPCALCGHRR